MLLMEYAVGVLLGILGVVVVLVIATVLLIAYLLAEPYWRRHLR